MALALAFVDSISDSATLRLDLTASPWKVLRDATTFGTPTLNRSVVSTLLSDGDVIPAAAYGNRTLTLAIDLTTATGDDAAASLVQDLQQELARANNYLRYRPETATNAVYFRTWRSDVSSVVWNRPQRRIVANVVADPWAYGVKQTPVSAATINADPAAGSNGCFVDVSSLLGDVETPAVIKANVSGTGVGTWSMIGVRRRGTVSALPLVYQAEAGTLGGAGSNTLPGNDAAMSGAGSNYVHHAFGAPNVWERIVTRTWPASASVDARGTYRVIARYRHSIAADTIDLRLNYTPYVQEVDNAAVSLPTSTALMHADLGLVTIPAGPDPVVDGAGVEIPTTGMSIGIDARRNTGSGNIDIDYLLFVPADDRLAVIDWTPAITSGTFVVDGVNERLYTLNVSNQIAPSDAGLGGLVGGWPMLSPNQTNRIVLVPEVYPTGSATLTNTVTVTVEYWPRYLHVRPLST